MWPYAALMTATLFLNFPFWFEGGLQLWVPGTLLENAGVLGVEALLIAVLFFVAPALASCTAKRPLSGVAESSLGTVPAWVIRVCCTWFLVVWMADLISYPVSRSVTSIFRREVSPIESGAIAGALILFLFVTGLQSFPTRANLALFSNKLGLAILVAALIRVHDGLPAALKGVPASDGHTAVLVAGKGLSLLALYAGPLVFLATDFGHRMQGRRQAAMTAAMGIVLPLGGTLLLLGVIGLATHASPYYQPSLEPDVAMALFSKAARSALPGRIMIAAVPMFGAVRFGAAALRNSVSTPNLGRRPLRVLLGGLCGIIAWCSLHPFDDNLTMSFKASAVCLTVAAAVLTGDFVSGRCRVGPVQKIDVVGFSALVAGLATAFFLNHWVADAWWEPGLFPSYAVGFTACVLGRGLQKKFSGVSTPLSTSRLG
jgi:hypothetical protein